MGQDYSYTQPSSSEDDDLINAVLNSEAEFFRDEAQSLYYIAQPEMVYPAQPECDDGIPMLCYCGGDAVVATSYTSKNPGRRYFTCDNVDGGDCHIWKWWDVGVTEELRETQRQVRQLKEESFECHQKLVKLQKAMVKLQKSVKLQNAFAVGGCLLVSVLVFIGLAVMYLTGRASLN